MSTLDDLWSSLKSYYLLNRLRSLDRATAAIDHVFLFFGRDKKLSDIDYKILQQYVVARIEEEAAPATVQYELRMLKKGFVEMERCGLAKAPLFPSIKVENIRQFFFEESQVIDVLKYLPWNLGALIKFLSYTGWRRREGTGLRWTQVHFDSGMIQLTRDQSKNKRGRWFPFANLPPLRELIEDQYRKTKELERRHSMVIPWVFWRIRGKALGTRIMDFRKAWARATREAGIPWMHVHDLRRTAVRRLIRAGVPKQIAKQLTGHLTDSIFDRYDIVDENDLRAASRRLSEYYSDGTLNQTPGVPSENDA